MAEAIVLSLDLLPVVIVLVVWTMVWKGIALWKAGNNKQLEWFVALFILNTLGILPMIYLKWFQVPKTIVISKPKKKTAPNKKKK